MKKLGTPINVFELWEVVKDYPWNTPIEFRNQAPQEFIEVTVDKQKIIAIQPKNQEIR